MATAAQLAARIEALEEAIAIGALSVSHAGKTVTYRSLSEMRQILASLQTQLTAASHVNVTRARFTR